MTLTIIFSTVILLIIIIYDIWALKKGVTISKVWHKMYKKFPFAPYAAGVVFGGHFSNSFNLSLAYKAKLIMLVVLSSIFLVYNLFILISKKENKTYERMCKWSIIPLTLGYLVGNSFWPIA